jgi:hypothetical protein
VQCPCWERSGSRGDVAVLVLEARLEGIPTRPPRLDGETLPYEDVAAMGFGSTHGVWAVPDTDGWRVAEVHRTTREGHVVDVGYSGVRASLVSMGGDSGGPLYSLVTGEILGVVSRGTEPDAHPAQSARTLAARLDTCAGAIARARAMADGVPRSEWPSIACSDAK